MAKLASIESIRVRGFRSLANVSIVDLPQATVLIGPNGAGKSNFIRFFAMMSFMSGRRLGHFVSTLGGGDDQLFGGHRHTPSLDADVSVRTGTSRVGYRFTLTYADPDRLVFEEEAFRFGKVGWRDLGSGHTEAAIVEVAKPGLSKRASTSARQAARVVLNMFDVRSIHDVADSSVFKKRWDIDDNNHLHTSGSNLAAVLYRLEQQDIRRYEEICRQVRRILPGFDRFAIEDNSGKVSLRWKAKWADKTIGAHLTSDGSLRFFSLVTLLNLPPEMLPDVLLIDEPELGLHPAAVTLIGEMIKSLAAERQVITATQSPRLVDVFGLDEILVLDLQDGQTEVHKLNPDDYQVWLDEYTSGALWEKNLLGGRP